MFGLGELCDIASGGTPARGEPSYFEGDVPWVKIGDMLRDPVISTEECISAEGLSASSAKVFPAGTLLLSIFATIGRTAVLAVPAATNQAIAGITPRNADALSVRFLRRFLDYSVAGLQSQSRGVAQANINLSILRQLPVPLPPIDEQRRIAVILDKADDLRARRRVADGMLVPLAESLLLDMLASGRRASWPQVEVAVVAAPTKNAIRTGPFGSQLLHSEFTDDGVPVLGIDNVVSNSFVWARPRHISEEKYQQLDRYTVHPGDVLVTIMGTCGRVAVAPADLPRSINTKHLCCITTDRDKCLPEYLRAALLFDPAVRAQLGARERGAVMPGLNMQIIRQTRVTLPPLFVQEALAATMVQADSLRADAFRFSRGLDEVFNSLAALAFSGGL